MNTQLDIVVGGQYGSEGKGAFAGALVDRNAYDALIRVAGPNAGHTIYTRSGDQVVLRCIPAACVRDHNAVCYIGPGSEVDLEVLEEEIELLDELGIPIRPRLFVHEQATILTAIHREREAHGAHGIFGSTFKGIGAARADRAMRTAPIAVRTSGLIERLGVATYTRPPTGRVMIEGTQGYWLGLHAGLYPHCTSSDCRAIDFAAMAGMTAWNASSTYVLFRTYPIRIAGNSGEMYRELTWEQLGARTGGHVKTEMTTVTKKVRRVGEFDINLVRPAMEGNRIGGGSNQTHAVLTFADYWEPRMFGSTADPFDSLIDRISDAFGSFAGDVTFAQTGPSTGIWL